VILKSEKRPVQPRDLNIAPEAESLPVTLVIDGSIIKENLKKHNVDENWLKNELLKSGVASINQILFATLDTHGQLYYQVKSSDDKTVKGA
jgi:uncharacterized membrane protein YcaP (DUF421 family)